MSTENSTTTTGSTMSSNAEQIERLRKLNFGISGLASLAGVLSAGTFRVGPSNYDGITRVDAGSIADLFELVREKLDALLGLSEDALMDTERSLEG
jgi:hypothetical protein